MGHIATILKREFAGYFATPVAFIFIIIFLALAGSFTFYMGYFLERGNADLQAFFQFHPWLYLLLIPAVSMRLWAEERKQGTIELFLTLPISLTQAVVGKFLAAWAFIGLALALTFPMWITVNVLGSPDNGVIAAGYLGSFLMAGSYLAIGSCLSAFTKNQVVAFVITITVCFLFTAGGSNAVLSLVQGWAPEGVIEAVQSLSFLNHFQQISKGVIDLRDAVYFMALIGAWLAANVIIVDLKKAD
ncbi:MAG: ABC transporter permease subunit [Alphaproteobacteria bacterium]|jgi:ABC-2 type transport system permease protein